MKISNETKVGALTAIAITILILGFNFLKGKNITETSNTIYAIFPSVDGLAVSSPVFIKGYQVGRVSDLEAMDKNLANILVSINLKKSVNIPDNSMASLDKSFVSGVSSVKIDLGNSSKYLQEGDTLQAMAATDIISDVRTALNPAMASINKTLISLDQVIQKLNSLIDPATRNNLQSIIANLHTTSQSLAKLVSDKNGALAKSLENAESISSNLEKNNGKIDTTLSNFQKLSARLAEAKIPETIESLKKTLDQLDKTLVKLNSKDGTVGLLLNDPKLYEEIRQTNRSLTILLDDFKTHPKRYVNVSVFGKKDKSKPLQSPIYDSVPKPGN